MVLLFNYIYFLLIFVLRSDPDSSIRDWSPNCARGISYVFGENIVYEYCKRLDVDLIIRAHQVVQVS